MGGYAPAAVTQTGEVTTQGRDPTSKSPPRPGERDPASRDKTARARPGPMRLSLSVRYVIALVGDQFPPHSTVKPAVGRAGGAPSQTRPV